MWVLWRIFNYWWIIDAVMTLKSNNCPGVSVLPPEFYRCLWKQLKTPIYQTYIFAFKNTLLLISTRKGLIFLLSKINWLQWFSPSAMYLPFQHCYLVKICATETAMILCAILGEFISGWHLVIFFLIKVFWVGKLWSLMFNFFTNRGTQDFL